MLSQWEDSDVSEIMRNFPGGFRGHFLVDKNVPQRTFSGKVKS